MDPNTLSVVQGAAGAGGGGEGLYVEEVFSTYLYWGTGNEIVINNGLDLDGEGGMVWIKNKKYAYNHCLTDTERGETNMIASNSDAANVVEAAGVTSFNSNGFTVGVDGTSDGNFNHSGPPPSDYVSFSFRRAPGFFDVVTWDGDDDDDRDIAHNLGCIPGCIMVKKTSGTADWMVYHKGMDSSNPEEWMMKLNENRERRDEGDEKWNDTAPTSTHFTVGDHGNVNGSGGTYVAYLFADGDDADAQIFGEAGDESIIKCGTYEGTGAAGNFIELGWEPQWLLTKHVDDDNNWELCDITRGMPNGSNMKLLRANTTAIEFSDTDTWPLPTGFEIQNIGGSNNTDDSTYLYIAIRRGLMKTPTDATEVFSADHLTNGSTPGYKPGFLVDWGIHKALTGTADWQTWDRLRWDYDLHFNNTDDEGSNNAGFDDNMIGFHDSSTADSDYIGYSFRRAPGFLDIVCYVGNDVDGRSIAHNLGTVPELMIIKQRDDTRSWAIYSSITGTGEFLKLENYGSVTQSGVFDTAPTETHFTVGDNTYVNTDDGNYIAYLFGSCPGVSKIGAYTSDGEPQDIDCGFSAGARFILIKRHDSNSDWYIFDTTRGINSGNEPFLMLNRDDAESTGSDRIDPYNPGFTVAGSGDSNALINYTGENFLYLAIA